MVVSEAGASGAMCISKVLAAWEVRDAAGDLICLV